MVVATADADGAPGCARSCCVKGYDASGFVFVTNYGSRRAREMAANPRVALIFSWHAAAAAGERHRAAVERSARAESAAYCGTRGRAASQLAAAAVVQSTVVDSRAELEAAGRRARRQPPGRRCRGRTAGAASGWCRTRWSSGRAGRRGCTTGCGTVR